MEITLEQYQAALVALGLNPATTHSVNLSPQGVRIVQSDRAVEFATVVDSTPAPDQPLAD